MPKIKWINSIKAKLILTLICVILFILCFSLGLNVVFLESYYEESRINKLITIYENIRYGKPEATYEEVIEAAKKAEIYEDIMNMPDGFETYVGERGTLLSGGQKQRVSIARIFLKNPPILILDEATSALDTITEQQIQKAFNELSKGRTTIIIAHRLSTIRDADRIVLIEKGRIQECGSHQQLIDKDGEYKKLYSTQMLNQ